MAARERTIGVVGAEHCLASPGAHGGREHVRPGILASWGCERKREASHLSRARQKLPWPFGGGGTHRAGATEGTVLTANLTEWYIRVMFFLLMLFYGATNFWWYFPDMMIFRCYRTNFLMLPRGGCPMGP
jgi:hypothetical protein